MAKITNIDKPEAEENDLDEARETPEVQEREQEEGTEQHSEVPLTEEFQMQVMDLIKESTKEQLSFIRDMCYQRDEELRKAESDKDVSVEDYDAVKA